MNEELKLAEVLYVLLTGTLIPLVILWLQRLQWKGIYKFMLAVALSVIAGTLSAYINGDLHSNGMISDFLAIFTVSQTIYQTFFKTLHLHGFLFPEEVVIAKTKAQVTQGLGEILDRPTAYRLLDEQMPDELDVTIEISTSEG